MGNKIDITLENCIATTHPAIAAQWHPTLNGELTPYDVMESSTDKVWWLCDKGHKWNTEVRCRCQRNNGCPCCSGRYVVKGETDLESQYPELSKEWDYEANGDYTPDKASIHSPRKVGWVCSKGHKWDAAIEKRTQRNQGCPYCSGRRAIPGETDLATLRPEVMHLWDYEKNNEIGVYPTNVKPNSEVTAWWRCENGHSWDTFVRNVGRGRGCPYCSSRRLLKGENDFESINPELAKEWHPTKNKKLKPSDVMPHYSKKVWWLGKCGHEWKATVDHRSNGRGCPICLGMKALTIDNSIFEMLPELIKEWDKEKNGDLHPKNVAWKSGKTIWWKCKIGHSYKMKPNGKVRINPKTKELRIAECPYCSGKKLLKGFNDLATTHPKLYAEWDFEKNTLKPDEVTHGSSKKAWWICEKGHSWYAVISSRIRCGCPICSGQQRLKGFNDLATTHPDIAAEWHPTLNGDVTPDMIGPNEKVDRWWICSEGHEYKARPHNRTMNNTGCPYCYGRVAIKGKTDLETLHPEIANEWHSNRNRKLLPFMVTDKAHIKVWWLCPICGYEYRSYVYQRTTVGSGCPRCAGKVR